MKPYKTILLSLLPLLAQPVHAIDWEWGGVDNLWSNPDNWVGDEVPNGNTVEAAFLGSANVAIDVDQDFTIKNYLDGFGGEGFTHTLYGAGMLTIDTNSSITALGINNATGNAGGTLRFNGFLTIQNTDASGATTTIRNSNSAGNNLLFDTGCSLRLLTRLQTIQGVGGTINFNCSFDASDENLIINSNNVFRENTIRFGTDSNGLTQDQLAAIDGGSYTLTDSGYLTEGNLEIPAISLVLAPFPKISFLSTDGQIYQLQKSSDMSLGSWEDVVGQSVVGDGTQKTLLDSTGGPPGETKAFYRVETN